MAGKVFFSVRMSLDGFIAPEERMDDPDMRRWPAQWLELQQRAAFSGRRGGNWTGGAEWLRPVEGTAVSWIGKCDAPPRL
jgi:hypothetical protein